MKTRILLLATLLCFLGFSNSTFAQDSKFDKNHPRRAEVNDRLANQNARIDKKEADGKMSKAEAKRLHKDDRKIRKEEKRMASKDGGHITPKEQNRLNRQENHVSRKIRRH